MRRPRAVNHSETSRPTSSTSGAPDFDSLLLDDEYYKELGMTPEEAAEQLDDVWNVDPDAYFMSQGVAQPTGASSVGGDEDDQPPVPFGPPAILLAGFRDHELAMARATLDLVGAHAIKVIPAVGPMLWGTVAEAVEAPEPDWEQPKPEQAARSGDWGSQRTILFSGLREDDALTILDIFEEGGLPTLMVEIATVENSRQVLGEVLAKAIKEQRRRKLGSMDYSLASTLPEPVIELPQPSQLQQADVAASQPEQDLLPVPPAAPLPAQPQHSAQPSLSAASMAAAFPAEPEAMPSSAQREVPVAEPRQEKQAASKQALNRGFGTAKSAAKQAKQRQQGVPRVPLGSGPRQGQQARDEPAGDREAEFRMPQLEVSGQEVQQSFQGALENGNAAAIGNFEHTTFASKQRELREAAADEMRHKVELSKAREAASAKLEEANLIDAAAAGEDTDAMLHPTGGGVDDSAPAAKAAARSRMEAVLQEMRASSQQLPEEKRKQLEADLKVLEAEQETVEKVLQDMGASLDNVPTGDREILKAKLREEAWQPTKDAIGAALACGVTAAELKALIDEAEKDRAEHKLGWYPSLATLDKKGAPGAPGGS